MDTTRLKRFAQYARRYLREQVTTRLEIVLSPESAARREKPDAVQELGKAIREVGKERTIDRIAYTWFNRFCALRFMDVNRYNRIGVVSPEAGQFQPEILAEAKAGHIDGEMVPESALRQILGLLDGSIPSPDGQTEAYRRLIVAVCNDYYRVMPFLFERIDDYTELLMPDDLLSGDSILAYTREAMTPENCESVESIGWLYQFYISEKKDEVFDGLKKNQKITPENIPAATQLFTPHWIVKYLVENSLGRLWMLNRPNSRLIEKMEYYIKPEEEERDFLRLKSPEEIKICDPACGSGHMLTYAFDLLYAIYEEEGYSPSDIPTMILTRNLYGIEIDERAGTLAAFALVMKAREKQRRFFRNPIEPNICILENVRFESEELKSYLDFVGRDLFTSNLVETLHQFEEADNFGSLIRPTVTDVSGMLDILRAKDAGGNLFLYQTHEKVLRVLKQADYLSPKYHVAIANPPYMDNKGMNSKLKVFLQENYLEVKSNLFSSFVLRCLELTIVKCFTGFMTPFVWMFLSSYEKLRLYILNNFTLTSLVKPSYTAFFDSAIVAVCAFVVHKNYDTNYKGIFIDLDYLGTAEEQSPRFLQRKKEKQYYLASAADFKKIPGAAIAYWLSNRLIDIFATSSYLEDFAEVKVGLQTGDNDRFLRLWFEVSNSNIGFGMKNRKDSQESNKKWFPYNKGGEFRKWYGNQEYIVNWKNNGYEIRNFGTEDGGKSRSRPQNTDYYFQESITWSFVSSSCFGVRFSPKGFIFDVGGSSLFTEKENKIFLTSLLCSKIAFDCMKVMNPTLNFQVGNVANIPVVKFDNHSIDEIGEKTIKISTQDWNSYETAWDFTILPLLTTAGETSKLSEKYQQLRQQWQEMTLEMQRIEEENNRIFIEAYGLKDELTPEVPLKEITLTCNPYYRYNADKSPEELETLLLADTMREFISYSVGCMFGRYSLDKPGLILANQGDTLEDYFKKVAGEKVDSDQWLVDSEEREFNDQQLIKTQNDGKQLQGSDSVAEIDGSSRTSLSGDETISQRGALRIDQSITEGSCIDTVEHSGGTSAPIDGGIQEFSIDSQGISSGSGNSTTNSGSTLLPLSTTTLGNYVSSSRNQQNDPRSNEKTNHWPLTPNHLSFIPTETNVIPILEGEWFADDISERFKQFLLVTFGQEHYAENLKFIHNALGIKKDIREYFLKDFYNDHVKRYKKRPIYWLFSSPKGSFNALIYLHRYRLDTVSVILNDYLREYRTKLTSRKENLQQIERGANITATEKTKAIKEIEKLNKVIQELEDYERDILYPLATRQLQIDLDDGVKVNYSKFGKALKTIPGMTKESD